MSHTPTTYYTWEELEARRTLLRQQVRSKEQHLINKCNELFAAPEPDNQVDRFVNYAKAGISVYDGFMTGFKLLKRFGAIFKKKRNKQ